MCDAILIDSGDSHNNDCYCEEDQGNGYTFSDEYGECDFCLGFFEPGTTICESPDGGSRICPDTVK